MRVTAASGGCLLFAQYWPFAILKPKNLKSERNESDKHPSSFSLFWVPIIGLLNPATISSVFHQLHPPKF